MKNAADHMIWTPRLDGTSRLERFQQAVGRPGPYADLWAWSTTDLDGFWTGVWRHFELPGDPTTAVAGGTMPNVAWFPDEQLNYAEAMLRLPGRADDDVVVRARSQTRPDTTLTASELRAQVGAVRASLKRLGVQEGDRVAAYAPNVPEALVLLLACASLGAVFTSCPPEFGTQSVVDRWSQIEPVLLLACDGYRYADKELDRREQVAAIRGAVTTIRDVVWLPYIDPRLTVPDGDLTWADMTSEPGAPEYTPLPFDAPLYVLFSSGTTGLPKPIVHRHGGIVLEHLKALAFHHDLGPADTFFWFTTTGWMMWNYLVSALGVGSTIVLVDGDPLNPDPAQLWRMVEDFAITSFGCSAPYVMECRKRELVPSDVADLSTLRALATTGAPLPAAGYEWLRDAVGPLPVANISGGTDFCTGVIGWSPLLPVVTDAMSGAMLGCAVAAYDEAGEPVTERLGELVITQPMPSMPLGFWGDVDGSRYRDSYFERFPGVWRHGDWAIVHDDGTIAVTGRSDATLNRGGVRLGTAEFYAALEELPAIADSVVVHLTDDDRDHLVLLVAPQAGGSTEGLADQVRATLRSRLSPRHVPDQIHVVSNLPRTLSGKRLEVPIKRILLGARPESVLAAGAITHPEALQELAMLSLHGPSPTQDAADRLIAAAAVHEPCAPVRDLIGSADLDAAYAVQSQVTAGRVAAGGRIVGRKIGLTSKAVQEQLGVDQPDFGVLFDDMGHTDGATIPFSEVLQPRVEAEIAFVLAEDLDEGPLDVAQVRAAVAYAVPALEVCGSRIAGWDISFGDTVADNASAGAYVLGSARVVLADLDTVGAQMSMTIDGEEVSTGTGAACLGDPINALVWLAQKARDFGEPLRAGQIVLSGALGPMRPVAPGAHVTSTITGLGTVTVSFSD